jgi:hypothetical protein
MFKEYMKGVQNTNKNNPMAQLRLGKFYEDPFADE